MAESKGDCCIARWGEGYVARTHHNTLKMDMIMLKYRPIAPKPVAGSVPSPPQASGNSEGSRSCEGRHAKVMAVGRGKKKTTTSKEYSSGSTNNSTRRVRNCPNGKKRKSSSPDNNNQINDYYFDDMVKKTDLTLLPLFPEAPDLSPTSNQNEVQNIVPFWLKFDNNTNGNSPTFEDNYSHCHRS